MDPHVSARLGYVPGFKRTDLDCEDAGCSIDLDGFAAEEDGGDHVNTGDEQAEICLLYTSPSPRDLSTSRMPSSA